jgi:F-type H+-transporting ATPase subunit b
MRRLVQFAWLWLLIGVAFGIAFRGGAVSAADEPVHAEAEATDAHGEGASAAHASGDVPLDYQQDLALWSLVVFVVFASVLRVFAWGPLTQGINSRESNIRQNIADAETARIKAEQMLAEHSKRLDRVQDEVREILAEARRDADHTKHEIINEAQREADNTKQRAVGEIERARDSALKDLFDAMSAQVLSATEHVLARSLNDGDQDRLIDEALTHFRQDFADKGLKPRH